MTEVQPRFKAPREKRAKGRARPDEPLAAQCAMPQCDWRAHERHHVLPRAAGGTDEASNTLDVCNWHHQWIHAHPLVSYEAGWLKRRGT